MMTTGTVERASSAPCCARIFSGAITSMCHSRWRASVSIALKSSCSGVFSPRGLYKLMRKPRTPRAA
jgi:hypothetical protein